MRKLSIVLASSLLALSVAELSVRRWFPVGATIYTLHPDLLHATIPNSSRIQPMPERAGGARNLISLNSSGFRGPELSTDGRPRVAVYGDSLVMGENVAQADTFVSRLAECWGADVEVVNAGASGYGPDQAALRLEAEFETLRPDLVLLVLCANNDLGDLLRNKLFRLEEGRLVRGQPILHPSVHDRFEEAQRANSRLALLRAWDHARGEGAIEQALSPEVASRLIPEYLEQAAWEYRKGVLEGSQTVYSLIEDVYDADVAVHPSSAMAAYKKQLLTAILVRVSAFCQSRNVPVVCVVVPSAIDLDPGFVIRVNVADYPNYDSHRLTDTCSAAAREAGLEVRDLYGLFESNNPAQLFVGHDDIHWNERGMELCARDVAAWIKTLDAGAFLLP